ncbi:MAG: DNA-protecting protein DprA [Scytonematopsis contorta HA4267-MV1]|jgi:predicted Rossmann fold nucleotide-binding protein DprA/Smf involved in DNA uptake|nr:DNA-protecting protein DprA [Scytonematopsis contorta HA4267-MV1]
MDNHVLPADTQAILLLCASFGQNRQVEPQPLTLGEYNSFTEWLRENSLRPSDLLSPTIQEKLQPITDKKLHPDRLLALLERGAMLSLAVEKWTNQGLWILGRSDKQYPKRLKQQLKHLAPAILYGVGDIALLSEGGLAIVGSREVNEEGFSYTEKVAQTSAKQGLQIISGGARGVDQAAMLGVLAAGGTAVGVLADSLTRAAVNGKYRSYIKEGKLTLVSSYDPEAGFNTGNAMGRNKYIYGLADYALVVETSVGKGGTWSGAIEALSKLKNISVFVRMHPTVSEGNKQLHFQGAKPFPVEPWDGELRDILKEAAKEAANESMSEVSSDVATENSDVETVEIASENYSSQVAVPGTKIYEAVLPFILNQLQKPKDIKTLAESLGVRQAQLQDWLNRAVNEEKIIKIKSPAVYVVKQSVTQLSLL